MLCATSTIASRLLVYIQTGEVMNGGKWSGVCDLDGCFANCFAVSGFKHRGKFSSTMEIEKSFKLFNPVVICEANMMNFLASERICKVGIKTFCLLSSNLQKYNNKE